MPCSGAHISQTFGALPAKRLSHARERDERAPVLAPRGIYATIVAQLAKDVPTLLEAAPPVTHGLQHGVDIQAARAGRLQDDAPYREH